MPLPAPKSSCENLNSSQPSLACSQRVFAAVVAVIGAVAFGTLGLMLITSDIERLLHCHG
jgi:hypothetical protein